MKRKKGIMEKIFADLHIHSKYSRATSGNMDIYHIKEFSKRKGLNVVATGDFTHPEWMKEIKENLEEIEGLLYFKSDRSKRENGKTGGEEKDIGFILSVEVSNVYEFNKKIRKIHNIILSPSVEVAEQISESLSKYGDLAADGRPTLNISNPEMVEILEQISKDIFIFPAHAWTPWYGVFGSKSGFDTLNEAFEDKKSSIHALETGLSSDPTMNFMVSSLDEIALVSNSDAHSPQNIGREYNIIFSKMNYKDIISAIKEKKVETVEYYPEEGKYHYDGHRNCGISLSPEVSKRYNNICPVCKKPLTIGVLHRIYDLADRAYGELPKNPQKFVHRIPLIEVIAKVIKKEKASKEATQKYIEITNELSEIEIMENMPYAELTRFGKGLADAIINVRNGKVKVLPGYDGVYGKITIEGFEEPNFKLVKRVKFQQNLF